MVFAIPEEPSQVTWEFRRHARLPTRKRAILSITWVNYISETERVWDCNVIMKAKVGKVLIRSRVDKLSENAGVGVEEKFHVIMYRRQQLCELIDHRLSTIAHTCNTSRGTLQRVATYAKLAPASSRAAPRGSFVTAPAEWSLTYIAQPNIITENKTCDIIHI